MAILADLYGRHAARLLSEFADRTRSPRLAAELCAETFAVALRDAHRFDPSRGDARAWLDGIAESELAHAERTGAARDRARRRLGMAALEPPGDELVAGDPGARRDAAARFIAELEEELDAAARFLSARRKPLPRPRLPALPRPPARAVRGALAGAAALALVALVAALALGGGDDDPPRPATYGATARLVPMLAPPRCFARAVERRPATPALPYFSIFDRRRRIDDALGDDLGETLPLATYDPAEPRLAADGRRGTRLHAVPSLGVSAGRGCAADDGPGVCLVDDNTGRYRCFAIDAIRTGLAFARTDRGSIAGIVPDGIGSVTLNAGGQRASARVEGNVYEAELRVATGTAVGVEVARPGPSGCEREVAPGVLARVAALRRAPTDRLLPMAALSMLREDTRIAEVVERGARFWGSDGSVEFWVVPVAAAGSHACERARGTCVVAVPRVSRPDAQCVYGPDLERPQWRLAPLLADRGALYGTVPDGIAGARVSFGAQVADVQVRDNVVAGVLPFPYEDPLLVEFVRRPAPSLPRVGIVDAGGNVEAMQARLDGAGYLPLRAIIPGIKRQPSTAVYWRPQQATFTEAAAVARAADAAELIRIASVERTPRPVLEAAAPVVVVVGTG